MSNAKKVFHIVWSGGPAGGKTTILEYIREWVERDYSVHVFSIPEIPTLLQTSGITWKRFGNTYFQNIVMREYLNYLELIEEHRAKLKDDKLALVIHDRGFLDQLAYYTKDEFLEHLKQNGVGTIESAVATYDAVYHLTSLAVDKPELYEKVRASNPTRKESVEEARERDMKLYDVWKEFHEIHTVISNTGFETLEDKALNLYEHMKTIIPSMYKK